MLGTTIMDEYWLNTQRQVNNNVILKRKAEQAPVPKKSSKDRRLSAAITNASIIDLSNQGPSGQSHTIKWQTTKAASSSTRAPELSQEKQDTIKRIFNENDVHINEVY
ncbi:hypothetical protein MBANPS3_010997 [Mucor bainieri]